MFVEVASEEEAKKIAGQTISLPDATAPLLLMHKYARLASFRALIVPCLLVSADLLTSQRRKPSALQPNRRRKAAALLKRWMNRKTKRPRKAPSARLKLVRFRENCRNSELSARFSQSAEPEEDKEEEKDVSVVNDLLIHVDKIAANTSREDLKARGNGSCFKCADTWLASCRRSSMLLAAPCNTSTSVAAKPKLSFA